MEQTFYLMSEIVTVDFKKAKLNYLLSTKDTP